MAESIMSVLTQEMDSYNLPSKIKLISEPGTYFTSSCMTLLCQVIGKKYSSNTNTVGYIIFHYFIEITLISASHVYTSVVT